ncbi:hypothetical protein ACH5RR_003966 [Cinchona calisaya]|uniref:Sm domain-containing protein n=1 Tax=Cinchona calisaya TaxID=153742 RepID=A0ABD3AWK3_9GENT
MHETSKEEFSDWPSGLLAIGTFGNDNPKDPQSSNFPGEECTTTQEHPEQITHDEGRELHKELKLLFNKQSISDSYLDLESAKNNVPPEQFFDILQSFEDDRTLSEFISDSLTSEKGHLHSRGKDGHLNKKNNISKRSLSFLLRKAFRCTGKSKQLSPLLKDPLPELKLEKSRMEKILRAILNKKIYPQSSNTPKAATKKCLDNKHLPDTDSEDGMLDNSSEGSKWVKTDSEWKIIVLLREGRKLLGTLRSFDQFANVVLEGACERVIVGHLYCDIPLGLFVIRGENVVLIGELNVEEDELPQHMISVSATEIRRVQKAERDASDLKSSMRKRMEFLDLD